MRNRKNASNWLQHRLVYTDTHAPFLSAGGHVGLGKDFTEGPRKVSVVSVALGGCAAAGSGNQVGS